MDGSMSPLSIYSNFFCPKSSVKCPRIYLPREDEVADNERPQVI